MSSLPSSKWNAFKSLKASNTSHCIPRRPRSHQEKPALRRPLFFTSQRPPPPSTPEDPVVHSL
ncbi:Hypothetical protein FKW44_020574 [Caligus rogercresseyi]|uniref:Uncharacterized protein n=1 Tax=Caligus rogercresseyi TaxID=217165 RepID=A0A7T8GY05_CALRO|nr:Hypothetical protein FKW44_020574 [Caligus rogercresseyi]